jgi:hypothetical protein
MSEVLEEELLEFTVLSSSWTNCSDWDATFVSSVCDGEAAFFKSLWTVAKADWALDIFPELSAPPSAVRSVES